MSGKTRVFIIDDHLVVRDGLSLILQLQSDMRVVGQAANGAEALPMIRTATPDVIVMDILMPVMDGIAATSEIIRMVPDAHILLLTSTTDTGKIQSALQSGATGAISKSAPREELLAAIRHVACGKPFFSEDIAAALENARKPIALSPRQQEMLDLIAKGLTNTDIARCCHLSTASVKFHLLALFRKLRAANRTEAVTIAMREQLLKI